MTSWMHEPALSSRASLQELTCCGWWLQHNQQAPSVASHFYFHMVQQLADVLAQPTCQEHKPQTFTTTPASLLC